jgi:hypothetical protein
MDIVETFHNHAGECRRMARFTHDREAKAVWNRMADRWLMLATQEYTGKSEKPATFSNPRSTRTGV